MPNPANFPFVITPNQGLYSLQFEATDGVLQFSASVLHTVVVDWTALVLRAFISQDGGQTWALVATGPAVQVPVSAQPGYFGVAAATCDRVGKIIYTVYYSPATKQLAVIPFNATALGGAFGAASNLAAGYLPGTTGNGLTVMALLRAQFQPSSGNVWIAWESGEQNLVNNEVYVTPFTPGVGAGANTKVSTTAANHEAGLGDIGLDPITNVLHLSYSDFLIGGGGVADIRHVSISSLGVVSASDLVIHAAASDYLAGQVAANNGTVIISYKGPGLANPTINLATGNAGAWTNTSPAFLANGTNAFGGFKTFFNGLWYLFYDISLPASATYLYRTAPDGLTWSAATQVGVYLATDPLDSNLGSFVPMVLGGNLDGAIEINSGAVFGMAFWLLAGGGGGGGVPVSPPQQKSFYRLPRFHCCSLRDQCAGGRMMQTSKGSLI
jgi:hypothetical protein